jgi:aryl-alcohol dehydrogenase-like predicted oxidoreductase
MSRERVSRRDFLKLAGAAPVAAGLAAGGSLSTAPGVPPASPVAAAPSPTGPVQVETRPLGATGVRVSKLALGDAFHVGLLYLKQCISLGVTHWDTAGSYGGGESEQSIGRYFEKVPGDRARVFVATKGEARGAKELTEQLERSLARMKTSYVDLYYLHHLSDGDGLTDELMRWGQDEKKRGRIKLFGVSTHENMAEVLLAATRQPVIDAVMVKYNYRLMEEPALQLALRASANAGKGITAMKVFGDGPLRRDDEADMRFVGHFLARGFTPEQAMARAVWENPAVSNVCVCMTGTDQLHSFVAASLDRTALSDADARQLRAHAEATRDTFCAGCSRHCQPAADGLPISDVMRFLMYSHRPGGLERARSGFADLPPDVRARLASVDLRGAEARCPNGLPIAELVADAVRRLA